MADTTVTTARRLAAAFVLYGLVATTLLAINMPPFQPLDEYAHFWRAAQVADGGLVATRFYTLDERRTRQIWAGGYLDRALFEAFKAGWELTAHPDTRATQANWMPRLHWTGERMMLAFPSSANYPPPFYAPAAIGVLVGRATRMTVVQTLITARLLTGATAVAVAAAAIASAGGAAVWLFAVLTLPMSLALIATPSQDALMLACSALAGALLVRALLWPSDRDGKVLAGLVITLVLVATARPPYGALALLPLALTRLRLRSRVLATSAIAGGVLAWSGIAAATAITSIGSLVGAEPMTQIARLRADPLLLVRAVWAALTQYWPLYLEEFVGRLGWHDLELPPAYHEAAWAMLVIAAAAAMLGLGGQRIGGGSRLLIAVGLLVSVGGLFAFIYVDWTVPGGAIVEGVQGRYFLPLALVGAALLPALGNQRWARLHDALVLMVAVFPVGTLAVVMRAVVLRYYLG